MVINKRFKLDCPKCKSKDKVISKCKKCFKVCCSNCSFELICIDCQVSLILPKRLIEYSEEEKIIHLTT